MRFLPDKSSMISCGWKASSGFIRVKEEDISSSMVISRHLLVLLHSLSSSCFSLVVSFSLTKISCWDDMEVPEESFHWSSWDSRTCYPRRAFIQGLTDDHWWAKEKNEINPWQTSQEKKHSRFHGLFFHLFCFLLLPDSPTLVYFISLDELERKREKERIKKDDI